MAIELKEQIQFSLDNAEEKKSYVRMSFSPSNMLPYYDNEIDSIGDYEEIKAVIVLLDKYKIKWSYVDTVSGNFDLNRMYIETDLIPAVIEYSGVNPIGWDVDDIQKLYMLDYSGAIRIVVSVYDENGKYLHMNA